MAERAAGIKLTLNASGFSSGLRDVERDGAAAGGRIGKAMRGALSDGVRGGIDSLKGALSSVKGAVLSLGGIAGGLGIAELSHRAIQTEASFRRLAFSINANSTELVSFRDLQREAGRVALEWAQNSKELGAAVEGVFEETGNADFARATMEDIAIAARGAHEPVATMGSITGVLNEKFKITEAGVKDALATVVGLGHAGGVSVGDLAEKLGIMGAYAMEAGLQGQEGFQTMIGLMNVADNSTGNLKRGISAVGGILEAISTGTAKAPLLKELGYDLDAAKKGGKDFVTILGEIIAKTGGKREKLGEVFKGEQGKFIGALGDDYAKAFDAAKGTIQERTAQAMAAYRASIDAASKSNMTWARLQEEASSELESTEAKMAVAVEKLEQAFAKPEVTDAINKLMSKLPALAEIISDVVDFAAESPILAGGVALGGIAAQGAASAAVSSMIQAAFSTGGTAAAGSIASALGGAGAQAAGTSIAGSFAGALTSGPGLLAIGAILAGYFIAAAIDEADKEREAQKDAAADTGDEYYEGGGGGSGASAEGGMGESGQHFAWKRTGPGGALERVPVTAEEMEARDEQAQIERVRAALAAPAQDPLAANGWSFSQGPDKPAAAPARQDPADARLFAEMMAARTLRVEVVNLPELGGGGSGGSSGAPRPGRVRRD